MTAIAMERNPEIWKFFASAFLALLFAALIVMSAARSVQPTEVKIVPCRTCEGKCACPVMMGSPKCLCPR